MGVGRRRYAGRHILGVAVVLSPRRFFDHPREARGHPLHLVERQPVAAERAPDRRDVEGEVERQSLLPVAHLLQAPAFGGAEIELVRLPFPRDARRAVRRRRARHAAKDRRLHGVGQRQRGGDVVPKPAGHRT